MQGMRECDPAAAPPIVPAVDGGRDPDRPRKQHEWQTVDPDSFAADCELAL